MKKAIAIFMILILTVTVFSGCNSDSAGSKSKSVNKNHEGIVEIFVKLMAGKDLSRDEVKSMQPEAYLSYMEEQGNSFSEYYDAVQEQLHTNKNAVVTAFGKDYKVTYEIIEDRKMSSEEEYQATQQLYGEEWYDADDLEEIRELILEIAFEGEKNEETFDAKIQVMKIGKGWYVLSYECDEMYEFFGW